jgi:hypothetical protein
MTGNRTDAGVDHECLRQRYAIIAEAPVIKMRPSTGFRRSTSEHVEAEPLRHRQTKGAATEMFHLKPPRHISTLH